MPQIKKITVNFQSSENDRIIKVVKETYFNRLEYEEDEYDPIYAEETYYLNRGNLRGNYRRNRGRNNNYSQNRSYQNRGRFYQRRGHQSNRGYRPSRG